MKIRNVSRDHGYARTRGWVGPDAAASTGLISVGSGDPPSGGPFTSLTFPGQNVSDEGGGLASVDIQAIVGELTNDSGADLAPGTVVVIDTTTGEIVETTTARDTRPVGVVIGYIADGASGFVQFSGFAPVVNVTASVTAGDYGETSTTPGSAQGSGTTRESGSFCIFTSSGTTPAAYLWGMTDLVTGTGSGIGADFLLSKDGEQHKTQTITSSGSSQTLDLSLHNVFDITLTANCTLTFANAPASGVLADWLLILRQGGSGSYTVTWPAAVKWRSATGTNSGSAPTLFTAVGAEDAVTVATVDGGTTYGGTLLAHDSVVTGFAAPSLTLSTSNAAGSASTAIRSDAQVAVFDATVPVTQAFGDAAATGSAAVTARRDHVHGMPADPTATLPSFHEHVASETHLSDGATGLYTLDETFEDGSVIAWNVTSLARLTVTETPPDQATVSPVGASGDSIVFDYATPVV